MLCLFSLLFLDVIVCVCKGVMIFDAAKCGFLELILKKKLPVFPRRPLRMQLAASAAIGHGVGKCGTDISFRLIMF